MVSAAVQVQPAQIKQSLNQVSSLSGVCISPFSLSRGFLSGHFSVLLFLYKLLSLMWVAVPIGRAARTYFCSSWPSCGHGNAVPGLPSPWAQVLTRAPWLSAGELHQSPWAQHQAPVNYSTSKIKALKGWHFHLNAVFIYEQCQLTISFWKTYLINMCDKTFHQTGKEICINVHPL